MNYEEHHGSHEERITLSPAQISEGFAAVMGRFKALDPDEVRGLRERAERAVLGHEAYALGQEYLERGDYASARRWLQVAAEHNVPGSQKDLDQLALHQVLDRSTAAATTGGCGETADDTGRRAVIDIDTVPCPVRVEYGVGNDEQVWVGVLEHVYADHPSAAARRDAARITEQAQREADEVIAEAKRRARAIVEDARAKAAQIVEGAREKADAVLSAAQQHAEDTSAPERAGVGMFVTCRSLSPDTALTWPRPECRTEGWLLMADLPRVVECTGAADQVARWRKGGEDIGLVLPRASSSLLHGKWLDFVDEFKDLSAFAQGSHRACTSVGEVTTVDWAVHRRDWPEPGEHVDLLERVQQLLRSGTRSEKADLPRLFDVLLSHATCRGFIEARSNRMRGVRPLPCATPGGETASSTGQDRSADGGSAARAISKSG